MKTIIVWTISLWSLATLVHAQVTKSINLSGYVETYYAYDFNKTPSHNRPSFIYSHNRSNEFNVNLAYLKSSYEKKGVRGNLALMAGTYTEANLAAEPAGLKPILEANVGIKLSKTKNIWLDLGVLPSHIGFESVISKDCWTLTRSIMAENTPYYEAGARLNYVSANGRLSTNLLVFNGWQRMKRQDGNDRIATGLQLNYKATKLLTINYSNYLGAEVSGSELLTRFYHNLYATAVINQQLGLTAGMDIGYQQAEPGKNNKNWIFAPIVIGQLELSPKLKIAARAEYYRDAKGVIIATTAVGGFNTFGYSANLDFSPSENSVFRIEAKHYSSKNAIFEQEGFAGKKNTLLTASFALQFN